MIHHPNRDQSIFIVDIVVLKIINRRVKKHSHGSIKSDFVLFYIGPRLPVVPFKVHHMYGLSVVIARLMDNNHSPRVTTMSSRWISSARPECPSSASISPDFLPAIIAASMAP